MCREYNGRGEGNTNQTARKKQVLNKNISKAFSYLVKNLPSESQLMFGEQLHVLPGAVSEIKPPFKISFSSHHIGLSDIETVVKNEGLGCRFPLRG